MVPRADVDLLTRHTVVTTVVERYRMGIVGIGRMLVVSSRSWQMRASDSCALCWFSKLGRRFKDFQGRGHAIILAFYRLSSNSPLATETTYSNLPLSFLRTNFRTHVFRIRHKLVFALSVAIRSALQCSLSGARSKFLNIVALVLRNLY